MEPIHQSTEQYDEICQWSPLPPKLIGKKVFLTSFSPEHADDILRFVTDETTAQGLGDPLYKAYTYEEELGILSSKSCNIDDGFNFMIWDIQDKCVIGWCCLFDIHKISRTAMLGLVIGSRKHRNGGRGQEALKVLLKFAFEEIDLHEISLSVYDFNDNAKACYEKCGFKEYGRRRESRYVHGRHHDEILMDILRCEYDKLRNE